MLLLVVLPQHEAAGSYVNCHSEYINIQENENLLIRSNAQRLKEANGPRAAADLGSSLHRAEAHMHLMKKGQEFCIVIWTEIEDMNSAWSVQLSPAQHPTHQILLCDDLSE